MDFDDILSEPAAYTARAGSKFRPRKATPPPNSTNAANNTPLTSNTVHQDSLHTFSHPHMPHIMPSTNRIPDPSPALLQSQEMGDNKLQVSHSHDGKNSAPLDVFSQHFSDKEDIDPRYTLHSELTIPNTHGDSQPGFATLGGEGADIFCSLDDIFNESTTTNASTVRKFQPRVKLNARPEDELAVSHTSNDVDAGRGPHQSYHLSDATLEPFCFGSTDTSPEFVPQEADNNRGTGAFDYEQLLIAAQGLGREAHTFLESVASEGDYIDDDLDSAPTGPNFVDLPNVNTPLPAVIDHSPEFPLNENSLHQANASRSNGSIPQVVDLQSVPIIPSKESSRKRKRAMKNHLRNDEEVSTAEEGTESGKSSRRSRRKSSAHADSTSGGTEEITDSPAEPSNYSLVDEDVHHDDDNEYREDTSRPKNARSAKSAVQNKNTGRRRKESSEGADPSSNKTNKKKFSHSTRRNKRKLDKTLLETPEEEIDPRKLPLKDVIRLAESREEQQKKDAATSKNSLPNQSVNNAFSEDAPYDPDDPFPFEQGPNPDNIDVAPLKLNYHTYMKKRPKKRWTKQDTELFYEAIRQFGTDFTMIEQLFPDLDSDPVRRRQLVKLKYKAEEKGHRHELEDALTNRSKDHSYFEQLIEKLRQAEEQHSDGDMESVGVSGEAEDNYSEINEVTESEPKDEVGNDLGMADDPVMQHSPAKSVHVTEEDTYKWSGGESDYEYDYVGY